VAAPTLDLAYIPATARRLTKRPICIDLFAGAGGLAEGFRQAGFAIRSGTDADRPVCSATFYVSSACSARSAW
jgi:hypothetical protein